MVVFGWGVTFQTQVGLNIQNATKIQQAWTWESCAKHLQSDLLPQNRKGHFFPLTPLYRGFIRDLFKGLLVTSIWVMHPGSRMEDAVVRKCLLNSTKDPFGFSELGEETTNLCFPGWQLKYFWNFHPEAWGSYESNLTCSIFFSMGGGGGEKPPTRFAPKPLSFGTFPDGFMADGSSSVVAACQAFHEWL